MSAWVAGRGLVVATQRDGAVRCFPFENTLACGPCASCGSRFGIRVMINGRPILSVIPCDFLDNTTGVPRAIYHTRRQRPQQNIEQDAFSLRSNRRAGKKETPTLCNIIGLPRLLSSHNKTEINHVACEREAALEYSLAWACAPREQKVQATINAL